MTRKHSKIKTKSKNILTSVLAGMLSFSLLFSVACSDSEKSKDKDVPTYVYTETDDGTIRNASFAVNTINLKLTDFPKSSVTGWGKAAESNMTSSSAKSGVIDVSDAGWVEVLNNLYDDSYFLNYFKIMYDFETSDVEDAIREQNGDDKKPTTKEVKEYIINNYFKSTNNFVFGSKRANELSNPENAPGSTDNKVYMLNNYLSKSNVGLGTGQSILSDSKITLKHGGYGRISVWVKTQNAYGAYANGTNYGANVRLISNIDGEQLPEVGIFNITDTEWTKYTIYVKADEVFDTDFALALGLGFDSLSATEGTAYFDGVEFEELTKEQFIAENISFTNDNTTYINYGSDLTANKVFASDLKQASDVLPLLYDMSIAHSSDSFFADAPLTANSNYTLSNKTDANGNNITGEKFGTATASEVALDSSAFPYASKAIKTELDKASYTVNFGSSTNTISVAPKSYAYVEFYVKNELSAFGSSTITADVFDVFGSISKKRPAIATITKIDEEWQKVGININNNYDSIARDFYLSIVIGPADVASADFVTDYATGNVTITFPKVATGLIAEFDDFGNNTSDNYKLYNLYKTTANGSLALYAGSASDFSEETDKTYPFTVAYSDMGTIETAPAIPSGLQGIVANHLYVTDDDSDLATDINTSKTSGLINTKYLSAYESFIPGITSALNHDGTKDDIQPLMIYNSTETSYGYICTSNSVSASAYAKVTVSIRVVGNAKATIYLVDTAAASKSIMTFDSFTKNVDENGMAIENGEEVIGSDLKLMLTIDSSMMDSNGWLTASFFVATGAQEKDFRVEVWNGSRDNSVSSSGFVFVKEINVTTASAFKEPTNWNEAFTESSSNPLVDAGKSEFDASDLILYKRELTEIEKEFNNKQTDSSKKVSYDPTYIWAKNDYMIYAVYNTVNPVPKDPGNADDDHDHSGCIVAADPSTFWLSFSSILLAVVLVGAVAVLVIRNTRRKRKANESDAVSHYTVTSRIRNKPAQSNKVVKEEIEEEEIDDTTEEIEKTLENSEKQTDEYVYGEVQNFGETESTDNKD